MPKTHVLHGSTPLDPRQYTLALLYLIMENVPRGLHVPCKSGGADFFSPPPLAHYATAPPSLGFRPPPPRSWREIAAPGLYINKAVKDCATAGIPVQWGVRLNTAGAAIPGGRGSTSAPRNFEKVPPPKKKKKMYGKYWPKTALHV